MKISSGLYLVIPLMLNVNIVFDSQFDVRSDVLRIIGEIDKKKVLNPQKFYLLHSYIAPAVNSLRSESSNKALVILNKLLI